MADGGSIAGWWIDNEKIYQTYDGTRTGKIKTQLNSSGTASSGGYDYSIITDAINAAMATVGGVLMQGGLINGYNIATVAARAEAAYNLAGSAWSKAANHKHTFSYTYKYPIAAAYGTTDQAQHSHPLSTGSMGSGTGNGTTSGPT